MKQLSSILLIVAVAVVAATAEAQQATKIQRIGFLGSSYLGPIRRLPTGPARSGLRRGEKHRH